MLDRKIRYCSLPEAIREQFLWGARSIVVAGTHGKTTTTSLTGWVLTHGGVDPSVLVGGIARNFGEHGSSYRLGQGRDFVIEGDEYDSAFFDKTAKFLKYLPDIAVINNIEFDHADIYADLDAVTLAFRRLVNLVPRQGPAAARRRQPGAPARCATTRYRASRRSARPRTPTGRRTTWSRRRRRRASVCGDAATPFGEFELPLLGAHNVRNALAAIAVATEVGIGHRADRARGCSAFAGVKRRLEIVGTADGVTVYDDFAHHPTAVAETLAGLRAANPDARIWAVFEPRSASSCRRSVPGRLRTGVWRRRRSAAGAGVPLDAAGSRAAVGPAPGPRPARTAASRRGKPDRSTTSSRPSSASTGQATSSCSCPTAALAASIRSLLRALGIGVARPS